jgi:hypothetical protein
VVFLGEIEVPLIRQERGEGGNTLLSSRFYPYTFTGLYPQTKGISIFPNLFYLLKEVE